LRAALPKHCLSLGLVVFVQAFIHSFRLLLIDIPDLPKMSHPLIWPPVEMFYPIGNTPAFCLTQDLAPEQDADILLLGCGDARNVLYTVYADLKVGRGAFN
jgi:hypothetical protein